MIKPTVFPICSRRCERRANSPKAKALYSQEIWEDIVTTWRRTPHVFRVGVGQSTLAYHMYSTTKRAWASHHIRRVLLYAINAGHVRILSDDSHHPEYRCTRFEILNDAPLPKPNTAFEKPFVAEFSKRGHTVRVFETTTNVFEVHVDGRQTQKDCNPKEIIGYLANAAQD